MSKNYVACFGSQRLTTNVTLIPESGICDEYENWYEAGCTHSRSRESYRITLDEALPVPLQINYNFRFSVYRIAGDLLYETINGTTETVPAGETTHVFYIQCRDNDCEYIHTADNLTLEEQVIIPICDDPPIGCTLTILTEETIVIAPTIRGNNDGSIYIEMSGATGSTVTYRINGNISAGTSPTSHTFTGLTAGEYYVYATEGDCFASTKEITVPEGEFRTQDFIVIEPATLVAAENPIVFAISTGINSIEPKKAECKFIVNGTINDNTIVFNLTYPQIYKGEFKSKGYPDRGNYFLGSLLTNENGATIGNNSNIEIATSIAESFQNDSIISRLYYITNKNNEITLKAKEYGAAFNLDEYNVTLTGVGITLETEVLGQAKYDGQLVADYSIYAEVFVNEELQFGEIRSNDLYIRVAELELPFNGSNKHIFDISKVLKNFVNSDKVDFTSTGFQSLPKMDAAFYIKYGEKYPLVPNSNTKKKRYKGTSLVSHVLNASLDFESANDLSAYLGDVYPSGSTLVNNVKFLNVAPNPKYVPRGSKEFLYFMLTTHYQAYLRLTGDIYYYDGSVTNDVDFFDISVSGGTFNFGGVNMLACGYDELGLASYELSGNTKIRKVVFRVMQSVPTLGIDVPLTEDRIYLFEIDEQPQKYDVAFLNNLGVYETFSFVGEVIEGDEIKRSVNQNPFNINPNGSVSKGFNYNTTYDTEYVKTIIVNSGTIDENTYNYIMNMLRSNRIYNYSNVNENYLRVINHTATKSTNSSEYTVQLQFIETIKKNNVTS